MTKLSTNSSLTSWSLSLWQIGKKSLEWIQYYVSTPFLGPKWTINPEIIFFFKKTIDITFIYLLDPFIMQDLKRSPLSGSRAMVMLRFHDQNGPTALKIYFFEKSLIQLSYIYWLCSLCKTESLELIQSYADVSFASNEMTGMSITCKTRQNRL